MLSMGVCKTLISANRVTLYFETKEKRQQDRRFILVRWSYTYAKWFFCQFGTNLDKYLVKKREVTFNSE